MNCVLLGSGLGAWAQPGALDPGFYRYSVFDGVVYALAAQPDGNLLVGGAFTHVTGIGRQGIARVRSNGSLDPAFDPGIGAAAALTLTAEIARLDNSSAFALTKPSVLFCVGVAPVVRPTPETGNAWCPKAIGAVASQ